jgi:nitroreductase
VLKDIVTRNRCYRRFYQDVPVGSEVLRELIDLARLSATGGNKQPLKFYISNRLETNKKIYPLLTWAGALPEWPGPDEGERPSAYIIILGDKEISQSFGVDHGIAAQTILLGATERGFGGCMLSSIKKENAHRDLNIPPRYEILLTVALGKPKEKVVIEVLEPGSDTKYWREPDGTHHVPKRKLQDIILEKED